MEVGLKALKAFEREMAHLDWHFLVDPESEGRKFKEHIAPSQGSTPPPPPGGGVARLSQREEENLGVAVRADVHKMAPGYLLDPGAAAKAAGAGSVVELGVC